MSYIILQVEEEKKIKEILQQEISLPSGNGYHIIENPLFSSKPEIENFVSVHRNCKGIYLILEINIKGELLADLVANEKNISLELINAFAVLDFSSATPSTNLFNKQAIEKAKKDVFYAGKLLDEIDDLKKYNSNDLVEIFQQHLSDDIFYTSILKKLNIQEIFYQLTLNSEAAALKLFPMIFLGPVNELLLNNTNIIKILNKHSFNDDFVLFALSSLELEEADIYQILKCHFKLPIIAMLISKKISDKFLFALENCILRLGLENLGEYFFYLLSDKTVRDILLNQIAVVKILTSAVKETPENLQAPLFNHIEKIIRENLYDKQRDNSKITSLIALKEELTDFLIVTDHDLDFYFNKYLIVVFDPEAQDPLRELLVECNDINDLCNQYTIILSEDNIYKSMESIALIDLKYLAIVEIGSNGEVESVRLNRYFGYERSDAKEIISITKPKTNLPLFRDEYCSVLKDSDEILKILADPDRGLSLKTNAAPPLFSLAKELIKFWHGNDFKMNIIDNFSKYKIVLKNIYKDKEASEFLKNNLTDDAGKKLLDKLALLSRVKEVSFKENANNRIFFNKNYKRDSNNKKRMTDPSNDQSCNKKRMLK